MTAGVPVILAFDRGFAPYSAVTIASVLAHSRERLEIICICRDAAEPDIARIEDICLRLNGSLRVLRLQQDDFADWKISYHLTTACYTRLLIPEMIDADKALYLDGDVLATLDIAPLLETSLGDALVAGCPDMMGGRVTRLPFAPGDTYLNSGVLLLDLAGLRQIGFRQRCADVLSARPQEVVWEDQCLINFVTGGRKLVLDGRWNVLANHIPRFGLKRAIGRLNGSAIIHANGVHKPWMPWCDPWLIEIWQGYARAAGLPADAMEVAPRDFREWNRLADAHEAQQRFREAAEIRARLVRELWQFDEQRRAKKRMETRAGRPDHSMPLGDDDQAPRHGSP